MIALAKEMKVVKQGEEDKLQGPMAMIITEKEVQVFLFPFQHDGSVLVTALALAPIKLFCGTTILDPSSLFLLAFITNNRPLSDITLQDSNFSGEQMRRYDVVTDNEAEIQKLEKLEKKEEELRKEKEEKEKELRKEKEEKEKELRKEKEEKEEKEKELRKEKEEKEELKKENERLRQLVKRVQS